MKTRFFSFLLITLLAVPAMAGCQAGQKAGAADDTRKQEVGAMTASGEQINPVLSLEEAQSIALRHAGFATDEVTALHTEYEMEYGIPQYDVEFHHGSWEYDYEIHADTGEILSFSKDD